jgi:hypothetical protein
MKGAHYTSLTQPLFFFIKVSAPSQETGRSCICVLLVSILSLSTIFLLQFGTVATVLYFLFFVFMSAQDAFLD